MIELDSIFGGINPVNFTQKKDGNDAGKNDILSAKAAMLGFSYQFGDYNRDEIGEIEKGLQEEAQKFNQISQYLNIYIFT